MADDPKSWIALSTAGLALAGSVYSAFANFRGQQKLERLKSELQEAREHREEQRQFQQLISKFRDPLMHAAYDLQSRIYNIVQQNFLTRYLVNGSPREQEYAIENTAFLFAQFLGWTEAIRQEVQFLDLGADAETKRLRRLQDHIYSQLQTDQLGHGFRLFAGEQRALGELMIERGTTGCRCIGYAAFSTGRKADIDRWLDPLREDLKQMAIDSQPFTERLTGVQHSMIDLLAFLDPDFVRFAEASRHKI
jgi:hypothetical protein